MKYIIISPGRSTEKEVMFWTADSAGYTSIPWAAGIYTAEQVEARPDHFNNGLTGVAIPLTTGALETIGLSCTVNMEALDNFLQRS